VVQVGDAVFKAGQKVTFGETIFLVNPEPDPKIARWDAWFRLMARRAVIRFYPNGL
jgi:hypothetical protein